MRKVVLLIVLLTLLAVIGTVAAQGDLAGVDPSGQTVVYWHQFRQDSAQGVAINALIEQFNSANEWGITVEGLTKGSYPDIQALMETAIQSGELPNLVAGFANAAASWGLDGVVVDLYTYYNDPTWGFSDAEKADINQGVLALNVTSEGPFDNTLIAWPNQISGQVLVSNLDMLKELGYEGAPATMEEFKDVACRAAAIDDRNGVDVKGYGFTGDSSEFEAFVAAFGGNIYDKEAGAYAFDTPEVIAALQFFQDLYNEGCAYFSAERFGWQADFNVGANIMFVSSTAGYTFIADGFQDYKAEWIVSPMPAGSDAGPVIQVFSPAIALLTSTPEKQLASWLFLKFLATPESQAAWSTGTGYYPLLASLSGDGLPPADEFARPDIYSYYTTALDFLNSPDIRVYQSPNLISYNAVRGLVATAVADVTVNGLAPADVAARLQTDAERAVADSQ